MPLLSMFTPCGMHAFSSKPSHAQAIYDAMANNLGGAYDLTVGEYNEASLYARAMSVARARYTLERAGNQYDPMRAIEMLPALERDWGVVPGETDGLLDRQIAVAAKQLVSRGSRPENLATLLTKLLGADFIKVRVHTPAEVTPNYAVSNFTRLDVPPKVVKLTTPICVDLGSVTAVAYENLDKTSAPISLIKGDSLMVQPENQGLAEVVTVVAAGAAAAAYPGTSLTGVPVSQIFAAQFTKSHDVGAVATTQNYPLWQSNQRSILIVVSHAAVLNAEKRRRINELMEATLTAGTTWGIVEPNGTSIGPFTIGVTPIGTTCIGTIPL